LGLFQVSTDWFFSNIAETIKLTEMLKPVFRIIILLILTVAGVQVLAQNFQAASVVSNSGDTLEGFIDYQSWIRNPSFVFFKKKTSDSIYKYSALDIQSFHSQGEYYLGAQIEIDKSPRETKDLTYSSKPIIETDAIFLRVLIDGKANLYTVIDENYKQHYFIEKDSSGIHELIYIRFLKKVQNTTSVQENKRYKGQLNYFFSDCPSVKKDISKIEYHQEALVKLFQKYSQCMGQEIEPKEFVNKKKNRAKPQLGFLIGASLTSITFDSDLSDLYYLTKTSFSGSVKPAIGISVNFILPANRGAWSIYTEFAYNAFSFLETYNLYKNKDYIIKKTITLDYALIRWANMVRFKVPDKTTRMFFNLGISQGFVIKGTNNVKVETWYFGDYTAENSSTSYSVGLEFGIVGGIGVEYKKFSAELRYIGLNRKEQVQVLVSNTHTFLLYLGYHL